MRKFLVQFLTKHLFRWISEEDLLNFTKEGVMHRGKPLNKDQIYQLSEQARIIRQMYLWKIISNEIIYTSYLMLVKARNYEETLSAKLLLRAEEIIRKKLEAIESLTIEKSLE